MNRCFKLAAVAAVVAGSTAGAQTLDTEVVISGMSGAVLVAHAPGDFDRIFVVRQTGVISVVDRNTGANLGNFLAPSVLSGGEQGLLGMAFHPDFQENGLFYINYTAQGTGATQIDEYAVSTSNPNRADASSRRPIITISQPFSNHNAGWLGFSPNDGYLYIPMGDGGSGNDPGNRAQNLNQLLGKTLRIDIDGDDFPADSTRNYAIPSDNPFVGVTGADEIWNYGLRNPFRCSFDSATGDFYLGDVGQGAREEVDYQPGDSMGGENYGWRCYEGFIDTPGTANDCDKNQVTFPILDFVSTGNCSVIGGDVYRGCAMPELDGVYFYADYCSSNFWTVEVVDGVAQNNTLRNSELQSSQTTNPRGFGTDAYGEIYICSQSGNISRIIPMGGVVDANGNGVADSCESMGCNGADVAEPFDALDIGDVVEFLRAFGASEALADLAEPTGSFDIADVVEFLRLFGEGCPE